VPVADIRGGGTRTQEM